VGDSTPAKETRIVVIGLIGLAVLIVGYCGVKAVQIGRTAYGLAQREGASLKSRMDSTFHVQDGSAVYLDNTSIAPIARVVVIHGDTGLTSQNKGAAESTMVAALRHEMVMYTAGVPTDSAAAARVAAMRPVYGLMHGRYDSANPVRIDVTSGVFPTTGKLPDGMLMIQGRREGIPLYLTPTPR